MKGEGLDRQILEGLCRRRNPSHLDDFQEALAQLERRGVDLARLVSILCLAAVRDDATQLARRRQKRGLSFQKRRDRLRRDLLAVTTAAMVFYRDEWFSKEKTVPETPIYVLCRDLRAALQRNLADVVQGVRDRDGYAQPAGRSTRAG